MFEQIVIVDKTGLRPWALEELKKYSERPIKMFDDIPNSDAEIIERIKDADCVLVSWRTQLRSETLSHAKKLKYIGMCCSLYDSGSANVDINYASNHGISVTGIRDYGDEGVTEYIVSALIRLTKGIGPLQWKSEPVELKNRKVGIIGLGTTGKMLADILIAFGSEVFYFSRSRKPKAEKAGITYLPLDELLSTTEIISFHLPKNTTILKHDHFNTFGSGKILINTSLGFTFDKEAFKDWISENDNFAIFDSDGIGGFKREFKKYGNIILADLTAGWTQEAQERLSNKVLENLMTFLN